MFTSSFKERDQDEIEININDVSYETLNTLVKFFYTSKLTITEHNVQVISIFYLYIIILVYICIPIISSILLFCRILLYNNNNICVKLNFVYVSGFINWIQHIFARRCRRSLCKLLKKQDCR